MVFQKGRKKTGGAKKHKQSQEQKLVNELLRASIKRRKDLVDALIKQAEKGDSKALKLIFERVLGRVKEEKVIDKEADLFTINILPPPEPKRSEDKEE